MAEIVQDPQLRYTPDNLAVAEMLVQFPGVKPEDPPANLKVVGWGNLADEIHKRCHRGLRVVIEGRLGMNTIERKPEGFKEKRAELTAQKIHYLGADDSFQTATPASTTVRNTTSYANGEPLRSGVATTTATTSKTSVSPAINTATIPSLDDDESMPVTPTKVQNQQLPTNPQDVDDIPF